MHSHSGNNKSPPSWGMLQWGILDNVRKYDPVMLFIYEECREGSKVKKPLKHNDYEVLVSYKFLINFVKRVF